MIKILVNIFFKIITFFGTIILTFLVKTFRNVCKYSMQIMKSQPISEAEISYNPINVQNSYKENTIDKAENNEIIRRGSRL